MRMYLDILEKIICDVTESDKRLESLTVIMEVFKNIPSSAIDSKSIERILKQLSIKPTFEFDSRKVETCEEEIRKNILYRISAFTDTGKKADIKKADTLFDLYERIDRYCTEKEKDESRQTSVVKEKENRNDHRQTRIWLLMGLLFVICFVKIDNADGRWRVMAPEDALVQIVNTLPQALLVMSVGKYVDKRLLN